MITRLNLATHPFRNRTTPYLLSLVLIALGAFGALVGLSQWYQTGKEIEISTRRVLTFRPGQVLKSALNDSVDPDKGPTSGSSDVQKVTG